MRILALSKLLIRFLLSCTQSVDKSVSDCRKVNGHICSHHLVTEIDKRRLKGKQCIAHCINDSCKFNVCAVNSVYTLYPG